MNSAISRALACLLIPAALLSSCSEPNPRPAATVTPLDTDLSGSEPDSRLGENDISRIHRLQAALTEGEPGALEQLAAYALQHADDEDLRRASIAAAGERAYPLFVQLMLLSARRSMDVAPVLSDAAEVVGLNGSDDDLLGIIREVSNHECCMHRGLLAASLDGLTRGLEMRGIAPVENVEASLRLQELASHSDEQLAVAARMTLDYFEPVPEAAAE